MAKNGVSTKLKLDTKEVEQGLDRAKSKSKELASVLDKLDKTLNTIDKSFKSQNEGITKAITSMSKLSEATKKAEKSQETMNKELKENGENLEKTSKKGKEAGTSLSGAFGEASAAIGAVVGTIKLVANGINKVIGFIGNLVNTLKPLIEKQAEYIEDLNFLDNAYGKANSSGKELLETLNQMVGYDPSTLVKNVAVFRQMGNAMEIPTEQADMLAENLTKLSVDVKSITGQGLEKVASKFQSAMAGNIRAVRAYGVDVTQAALQQTALNLGIEDSVKNMSRAEKSILIYLTMERQLSTANGDLSRTVNSVANQWEIFQNQINQLGRLIGGFFIPILSRIIPVLNGIIMALNTIISLVMSFFGIDAESLSQQFGTASVEIDDISDGFDNMATSAGKAGKAAKEAQKSLRGFDKLNNITTPTSSSGGGGGGSASGGIGGINPKLLDALKGYNLHLEEMSNWATKIRDKIMGWLGFTKLVDEDGKLIGWRFEGINNIFNNIYKVINKIFNRIKQNPVLNFIKSIQTIIVPFYGFLYSMFTNEDIFGSLKKIFESVYNIVAPLVETITKDLGGAFQWLQDNVLKPISDFIDDIFASILRDTLIPIFDKISKDILPKVVKVFDQLWNKALKPIVGFIGDILSPAIETLTSVLSFLWKNVLQPIVNFIMSYVLKSVENVWTFLADYLIPIITTLIGVIKDLWDTKLKPIYNFLKDVFLAIIETITKNIKTMIDDIKKKFSGILDFITKVFKGDWEGAFKDIKKVFDEKFSPIKGILENIEKGFNKVKDAAKKVKDVFSGVGSAASTGLSVVKGLLGLKYTGGLYEGGTWKPMHAYAGGGFPSHGELFMARETSGPELVGKIGSSTAVMNNQQILDQMTIAVARGMSANKQDTNVNIIAKGDTQGLLDFIQFEQIRNNRQFGL